MRPRTDSEFAALWDLGCRSHPLDRAILMLRLASPETPGESAADWPLGRRNRALIELHRSAFGSRLPCWVECRTCREKLEFELDSSAILEAAGDDDPSEGTVEFKGERFRFPTSRALAKITGLNHANEAAGRLAEACRIGNGQAASWSEADLTELGHRLAAADPLAETRLNLVCPQCGDAWEETLDVPAFLWSEIEARVKQALADVHALASAYGWSEREILSLTPARRAYYLRTVQG